MSSLANGCAHCGSLEHSTNKCPHFLSTKCIHCGSLEHSSNDCPHGLLSTKCIHCGSVNHASSDCPHGMLSTKCIHCGSLEHSSNNCPHGLQSKCIHCGSVDHSSNQCPNAFSMRSRRTESYSASSESGDDAFMGCAVKFIVIIGLILLVVWFVFSVAIPLILINTAIITLIAAFVKPKWNKLLLWVAIVTGALVVVDYNAGWLSGALIQNISISMNALKVFMYINLTAGLIAAYFVIRNYLDERYPKANAQEEISNKNLLVLGGLVLIGGLTVLGQEYFEQKSGRFDTAQYSSKESSVPPKEQPPMADLNGDGENGKNKELAIEQAYEKETGQKIDVNLGEHSSTITSEGGTSQYSSEIKSWPKEIPSIIPKFTFGKLDGVISTRQNEGNSWTMEFKSLAKEAVREYEKLLISDGFQTNLSIENDQISSLTGEKGKIAVTFMANQEFGVISIYIEKE